MRKVALLVFLFVFAITANSYAFPGWFRDWLPQPEPAEPEEPEEPQDPQDSAGLQAKPIKKFIYNPETGDVIPEYEE